MLSLCAHQHTTLIIATHDPELMEMTDRKIYLKDGRMETKS
jgi:ABC-type lipoprotein export system ATPase subunit